MSCIGSRCRSGKRPKGAAITATFAMGIQRGGLLASFFRGDCMMMFAMRGVHSTGIMRLRRQGDVGVAQAHGGCRKSLERDRNHQKDHQQ